MGTHDLLLSRALMRGWGDATEMAPVSYALLHTDIPVSPWYVVESDSKKHARLNMMAHLLSTIDYGDVEAPVVDLPAHPVRSGNYHRPPRELSTYVDDYAATVLGERE